MNVGHTSEHRVRNERTCHEGRNPTICASARAASSKSVGLAGTNDKPLVGHLDDTIAAEVDRANPEPLDLIQAGRGEVGNNDQRKPTSSIKDQALGALSGSSERL